MLSLNNPTPGWCGCARRHGDLRYRDRFARPHAGAHRRHPFADRPGQAAYIPLRHKAPDAPEQLPLAEVLARLKPWLEDASALKIARTSYDRHVLTNHGIACGRRARHHAGSYVLEAHKTQYLEASPNATWAARA